MNTFVVPSSFDPDDVTLHGIRLALPWGTSFGEFIRNRKTRAVLTRVPLFWQLEPMVHHVCRAAGIPICVVNPENIPVNGAAISEIPFIDTVLTSSERLDIFIAHLSAKKIRLPQNWFVIHPLGKVCDLPEELGGKDMFVQEEVHVYPGVVQTL